jgi:hypothetical protein
MLRRSLLLLLIPALLGAAAPQPKAAAPPTMPHTVAMFLANLSGEGKKKITCKAAAIGTRFFYEDDSGVTVYAFDGTASYRKETFLKGSTIAKAIKKYEK